MYTPRLMAVEASTYVQARYLSVLSPLLANEVVVPNKTLLGTSHTIAFFEDNYSMFTAAIKWPYLHNR